MAELYEAGCVYVTDIDGQQDFVGLLPAGSWVSLDDNDVHDYMTEKWQLVNGKTYKHNALLDKLIGGKDA